MTYDYSELIPYLLFWFERNARILAWRENPKPYYVWVSEIMLQQTRVEAVKEYFDRFTSELPDITALAQAPEEKLLKLWEGLGYYNRVRNMQKAAKIAVEQYGGDLPADYEQLKQLPGIGSYTAGAISSIAFSIPEPCVDGNVLRVLKRIAASYDDITKEKVKKQLEEDLREIMPKDRPGDFNQSLMELGALVCLPNGKPLCDACPVQHLCKAYKAGIEQELPIKAPKKERRVEERTVFLIRIDEEMVLHKRENKGLLAGMWEFPNVEGHLSEQEALDVVADLLATSEANAGMDGSRQVLFADIHRLMDAKHIFSHIEWRMWAYEINLKNAHIKLSDGKSLALFRLEQVREEISIPSAFEVYRNHILN